MVVCVDLVRGVRRPLLDHRGNLGLLLVNLAERDPLGDDLSLRPCRSEIGLSY